MDHFEEQKLGPTVQPSQSVTDNVITERSGDVDDALRFLNREKQDGAVFVDEKKLVKKIDWMVVPLMFCCYMLQYLDKTLLNYASVMGLLTDANVDINQYANLALLFYVGFLVFELPHGYLMQRFPAAKYLGTMVVCWGIVVATTAACKSYASLAVTRFLLGVFESAISPGLILIVSMWYKKKEQPRRIGLWYIGVGVATILGSLISFGFQHYTGTTFFNWQIMFLVVGLITICVGGLVIAFLPDNPMSSRLTHDEKIVAVERLRSNNTGIENKHFKWAQIRDILADPQAWLLFFIATAGSIPNGAVSSFASILIKSFGFTTYQTTLLQIPNGAISLISVLTATNTAGRGKNGFRVANIIVWSLLGGITGGCLLAFSSSKAGKLVGNYMVGFVGAFLPCTYSLAAANTAGHTKKVSMNAIVLMGFCLGNILGPLTFRSQDAPDYTPAKVTIVAVDAVTILLTLALLAHYMLENKRRDKMDIQHVENIEFADLTDRKNKEFRYSY